MKYSIICSRWRSANSGSEVYSGLVSVVLLVILSTGLVAAAEPSWRQIRLDQPSDTAGGSWSDDTLPATAGLFATLGDQTQCRVEKHAGVKGLIAMADRGLNGPFLALWWDESGELTATVRSVDSLPVESFTLGDEEQTELILIRRSHTIYAYAVASGAEAPLIAVDFALGSGVVAGVMADEDSNAPAPAMSPIVAAPSLIGDVLQKQPATTLAGNWISEDSPGSMGGSHLLNRGDTAEASAAVRIENLLPGTHELWIRYTAAPSRSANANVTVEGFGKPASLVVNQQISGGLWLSLGRYETQSATSTTIRLAPGQPGSGSISIDAVHALWTLWEDENQDQRPDLLEGASVMGLPVEGVVSTRTGAGFPGQESFRSSELSSFSKVGKKPEADSRRSVIFVHAALGNDSFDGRADKPQAGAWFSVRGGPKRTIGAALKSVPKTTQTIELHLDGKVGSPGDGFQNLGIASIVLVPGLNGASLETLDPTPDFQHPPIPPPPVRP